MPHVRFANPLCPWPDCGFQFWYIDYCLELSGPLLYNRGVAAWESGFSLIAPCPRCSRLIAFSKKGIFQGGHDGANSVSLSDDWFKSAILLDEHNQVIPL